MKKPGINRSLENPGIHARWFLVGIFREEKTGQTRIYPGNVKSSSNHICKWQTLYNNIFAMSYIKYARMMVLMKPNHWFLIFLNSDWKLLKFSMWMQSVKSVRNFASMNLIFVICYLEEGKEFNAFAYGQLFNLWESVDTNTSREKNVFIW